jgi:hypothetical protein
MTLPHFLKSFSESFFFLPSLPIFDHLNISKASLFLASDYTSKQGTKTRGQKYKIYSKQRKKKL